MQSGFRLLSVVGAFALALGAASAARAQSANSGFQINRYEPSAAGEWSFWVDHPWYSSTRFFAAGITLNYGHNPVVAGRVNSSGTFVTSLSIIEHQVLTHIDLAGSFLDRVLLTASLPVVLYESGTAAAGIVPSTGVGLSDPRLGFWVRLFGQPYQGPVSLSLGGNLWIPLRGFAEFSPTSSDSSVRVLPKVALGGLTHHVLWSFSLGFLYRPQAQLGNAIDAGSTVGSEVQVGAAIAYADRERRFAVGPEAAFTGLLTSVGSSQSRGTYSTALELLLGAHYNVKKLIQLGLAGGTGVLREPGTPDGRLLVRVAYAPYPAPKPADRDKDGIADVADACPDEAGSGRPDPKTHGCPDRDDDGVIDKFDRCPEAPQGARPDPARPGCPVGDADGDGVLDLEDQCKDEPAGEIPDPARGGCPARDRDKDGVVDFQDLCPDAPQGETPDLARRGCPAGDKDHDGVVDSKDQCPDGPAGLKPDPNKPGCPLPDTDYDTVVDTEDACPDQPGAPTADPKTNGCPSVVKIENGQLVILQAVNFAKGKDLVPKKSFALLALVAQSLKLAPTLKRVEIGVHTDSRGNADKNRDLSARRAQSVMKFLIEKGIAAERLSAQGYGPDKPLADNKTSKGRERNRRVEFLILDPPPPTSAPPPSPAATDVPSAPSDNAKAGKRARAGGNARGKAKGKAKGKARGRSD